MQAPGPTTPPPVPPPPPMALTQPRKRSGRGILIAAAAVGVAVVGGGIAVLASPSLRGTLSALFRSSSPETAPATSLETGATPEQSAKQRDMQRYADLNAIRIALDGYANVNATYPETLAALVPSKLTAVPTDPSVQDGYRYRRAGSGYVVAFTMEQGVFALSPGDHIMSQRGFDLPPQGEAPLPDTTTEQTPEPPSTPVAENPLPPSETPDATTDSDDDGATDSEESAAGSDPATSDTDGDGLSDGEELHVYATSAIKADTDGDGYKDGDEAYSGFDPNGTGRLVDTDGDGLADLYEQAQGLDPTVADMDGDGLADGDEKRVFGTDPKKSDTDGDGFTDSGELKAGYDPLGPGAMDEVRRTSIANNTAIYGLHAPTTTTLR